MRHGFLNECKKAVQISVSSMSSVFHLTSYKKIIFDCGTEILYSKRNLQPENLRLLNISILPRDL
jgi:hypothetical protein